jgi:hypothetical protein
MAKHLTSFAAIAAPVGAPLTAIGDEICKAMDAMVRDGYVIKGGRASRGASRRSRCRDLFTERDCGLPCAGCACGARWRPRTAWSRYGHAGGLGRCRRW